MWGYSAMFFKLFSSLSGFSPKPEPKKTEPKPLLPEPVVEEETDKTTFVEAEPEPASTFSDEDIAVREGRLMANTTAEFNLGKSYDGLGILPGAKLLFMIFEIDPILTPKNEDFGSRWRDTIYDDDKDSKIYGLGGNDKLYGNGGNDFLFGQRGNDRLYGGDGEDVLDGGKGYDVLHGGEGVDIFVFRKNEGTTDITDFELGLDVLDLEGFQDLTFDMLKAAGRQVDEDIYFEIDYDTLIIRDADLLTLGEPDLCAK